MTSMTEVSWITFWQGFRGIHGWPPGRLTAPTARLRGSRAVALAPAPAFHDPTVPPMDCRKAVGRAAQDRPRHGCRGRAPTDGFTACPVQPGPSPQQHINAGAAPFTTNRTKKKSARPRRIQRPVGPAGERGPADPVPAGERLATKLSTSGSASSRSRSGAPVRPAAARSPAAWPAHRHSCRPSGRTPGWPWRPPRSSAACAPG